MTGVQARPANTWMENGGFVGSCCLTGLATDAGRRESGDDEQGSDDDGDDARVEGKAATVTGERRGGCNVQAGSVCTLQEGGGRVGRLLREGCYVTTATRTPEMTPGRRPRRRRWLDHELFA